ncbi:MAG: hypothetical protein UT66_C0001G0049 [candidate division CPR2 bacterium GW2011_GWC1_39_9]|nr:MAG: hypothetical protein UT66_C0001G0049 [candidate division CPR2 bacterium GW2011_GWC1_39_9]
MLGYIRIVLTVMVVFVFITHLPLFYLLYRQKMLVRKWQINWDEIVPLSRRRIKLLIDLSSELLCLSKDSRNKISDYLKEFDEAVIKDSKKEAKNVIREAEKMYEEIILFVTDSFRPLSRSAVETISALEINGEDLREKLAFSGSLGYAANTMKCNIHDSSLISFGYLTKLGFVMVDRSVPKIYTAKDIPRINRAIKFRSSLIPYDCWKNMKTLVRLARRLNKGKTAKAKAKVLNIRSIIKHAEVCDTCFWLIRLLIPKAEFDEGGLFAKLTKRDIVLSNAGINCESFFYFRSHFVSQLTGMLEFSENTLKVTAHHVSYLCADNTCRALITNMLYESIFVRRAKMKKFYREKREELRSKRKKRKMKVWR